MRMTSRRSALVAVALSVTVLLSGCAGSASPASSAATEPAAVDTTEATPPDSPTPFPTPTPSVTYKPKPKRAPAIHRPATHRPKPRRTTRAPAVAPGGGATAKCNDGTLSYSQHHQGTCSHHGGVAIWYK